MRSLPPLGRLLCILHASSLFACALEADPREALVVDALREADDRDLRVRPTQAAAKFAAMADAPQSFFRGALPVYSADFSAGRARNPVRGCGAVTVPLLGDPHVENFGTLEAPDGSLALEANDLDAADRGAPGWDVLRLASSLVFAARASAPEGEPPAATEALAEVALTGLRAGYERGSAARVTASDGARAAWVTALFSRAARAAADREELALYGTPEGGLRRGALPEDPETTLTDLPPAVRAELPRALAELVRDAGDRGAPLGAPVEGVVTDAARLYGKGIASRARVRVVVRVEGPGGARLLEVKELADANLPFATAPEVRGRDLGARVRRAATAAFARRDATSVFGTTTLAGFPVLVRPLRESERGLRISKLTGAARTAESLSNTAELLGGILARSHRSAGVSPACLAVDAALLRAEALAQAAVVAEDAARFPRALARLGPTLGTPTEERARGELGLLLGEPR